MVLGGGAWEPRELSGRRRKAVFWFWNPGGWGSSMLFLAHLADPGPQQALGAGLMFSVGGSGGMGDLDPARLGPVTSDPHMGPLCTPLLRRARLSGLTPGFGRWRAQPGLSPLHCGLTLSPAMPPGEISKSLGELWA